MNKEATKLISITFSMPPTSSYTTMELFIRTINVSELRIPRHFSQLTRSIPVEDFNLDLVRTGPTFLYLCV